MATTDPAAAVPGDPPAGHELDMLKQYLAEPRFRIRLDDLVGGTVRAAVRQISDDKLFLNANINTGQDVAARLKAYEDVVRPVLSHAVLLGRWATAEQRPTLLNAIARLCDNAVKPVGGTTLLLAMRWYPASLFGYAAGIAALSIEDYDTFAAVHSKRIGTPVRRRGAAPVPVIVPAVDAMLEMAQGNAWKAMPGYDRTYTPESDYVLKTLQPQFDDLLYLGESYGQLFDRYEILRALVYADATDGGWAPVGRFGTKHVHSMGDGSPYTALRAEAAELRDRWGPIRAGLFRGAYARFEEVTAKFEKELLSKLSRF